jgi:hypothetical protein
LNKRELDKLKKTCDKIYESDEYKQRRKEQSRFLKYYTGRYWPIPKGDDESKQSEIAANLIFSTVMTIAPMLTDNKPIWSIRARTPHYQPIANVYKAAGDSLWCSEDMDAKIFKVVMDALVMKNGIMQVSFDPDRKIGGEVALEVIDPRTYFQAPGFEDNWDAPLCGTKVSRSLWWIRKMYPKEGKDVVADQDTEKKGLSKAVSVVGSLLDRREDHEHMTAEAAVYTVWMKDDTMVEEPGEDKEKKQKKMKYPNGRMIVFTREVVLEDKPYPYNHGKPPWVFLYDYIVPHSTFGIGEVDQIEGLVLEYNLFLRRFAEHCRKFSKPNCAGPSSLDPDKTKEMLYEGDNYFTINPGEDIPKWIPPPPFDQPTLQFINGMPTIIQDVSGVTETSKGMASKKQRQSAHEITALLETSYTRTRQRVRNLEAFIKRVFTLVVELMQQFYDEPREFSIKNNNNEIEYAGIQNTKGFADKIMRPEKKPGRGEDEEEENLLKQQWQDYEELMTKLSDEEAVSFPFEIDIETNSTLPMDQQSLANMAIQVAQLGHMDTLTLLETLRFPNPERIVERLKKDAAERQTQPQRPPGEPGVEAAMGGQVG